MTTTENVDVTFGAGSIHLRLHPRQPRGLERRIREPPDRFEHRSNGIRHVRKVDEANLVRWLVILLVETVARHRVRDDPAARELDVVGALEKLLLRVRDPARAWRPAWPAPGRDSIARSRSAITCAAARPRRAGRSSRIGDSQRSGRAARRDGRRRNESRGRRFLRSRRMRRQSFASAAVPAQSRAPTPARLPYPTHRHRHR